MTSGFKKLLLVGFLATFVTACEDKSLNVDGHAQSGKKLFQRTCQTCHAIEPTTKDTRGPNLHDLIGRQAGSASSYGHYSASLASYDKSWTPQRLAKFLAHPGGFLREELNDPQAQSRMNQRVKNPEDRKDIVAYLANLSDGWSTK